MHVSFAGFDQAPCFTSVLFQKCRMYLCGTKLDLVSGENKVLRQVDYHNVTDYADGRSALAYFVALCLR